MSEDQDVAVCMPVASGPSLIPSEIRQCSSCKQDVWVSPSMARVLNDRDDIRAMCVSCAVTAAEIDWTDDPVDIPGQREELERQGIDYDKVKGIVGASFQAMRERHKKVN